MGCVYRARDLRLGREVALKCPRPDLLERPRFRSRFLKEARAASRLAHPNITTVFETFEAEGLPWMAMELVPGGSLRDRLASGPLDSVETIVKHAEGLTSGLVAAHAAGLLHLDINPNNVLVGGDGRARLSDFGLAKAQLDTAADVDTETLTQSTEPFHAGKVIGTRGYMSPEQALGRDVDERSDIFSLGLVMYEMCTGTRAVPVNSDAWLDALLHREPDPISRYNSDIPEALDHVIRKATAKRPDERYQTANDMLTDLRVLRRRLESSGSSPSETQVTPTRISRPVVVTAAALAAVAVLATAAWSLYRSTHATIPLEDWMPRQLTSDPGWEAEPAVSPDGSLVAFASNAAGNSDIWLIDIAGSSRLQLTTHAADDVSPTWTPDGTALVFVSYRGGTSSIWRIPMLGGTPAQLVENAVDPAISPDGTRIAFARPGKAGLHRIFVTSLDHEEPPLQLTTDASGLWDHQSPAWSPDGRTICYSDFRDMWVVPADGSAAPRKLTADHAVDRDPEWTPDGREILFASLRAGAYALWRVPSSGGRPSRVTVGTGPEVQPSLVRSGNRLTYSTYSFTETYRIVDRITGEVTHVPKQGIMSSPSIAPDGSSFVYVSDVRGPFELWRQPLADGHLDGKPYRLIDHPGAAENPDLSPDGRWVAYLRVIDTERDIWIVPVSGGIPIQFTEHPGVDTHPAFSPDGDRLAWVSDREGHEQIWVAPIADGRRTGEPRRLSDSPTATMYPTWSPDGTTIAYQSEGEVWLLDVGRGPPARKLTDGAGAFQISWGGSNRELLVSGAWGDDRERLWTVDTQTGAVSPSDPPVDFGAAAEWGVFDADPQGRLIVHSVTEVRGDLWVLEPGE